MAPSRRPSWLLFTVALAVLALDACTKTLVESRLAEGESLRLIPGALYLTHTTNTGGAFGLSTGTPWFFGLVSAVVVLSIIWNARSVTSRWRAACLGLILGGASGNLVDRLLGGPMFSGQVVDFIDVRVWPVFNLADSAIVVGTVMLAISYAKRERADGRTA
jgi:signal peptidase II